MPLETATYISDFNITNPAHSDGLSQADSHLRLIKAVLQASINADAAGAYLPKDGTSSAPSLSFSSERTLGIYRAAAGKLGIAGRLVGMGTIPIGCTTEFCGPDANIPAGYFACDGTAISRTTYADLFAAIGTTWGAGDGSTTFNLPNFVSRFTRHRDNSTLAGATGTLQNPCNLSHTHTYSGSSATATENAAHAHSFSGTTGAMNSNASHTHSSNGAANDGGSGTGGGGFALNVPNPETINATNTDHTHNFSGTTATESAAHAHAFSWSGTTSAGSADGSETRPYSATVLKIIRAL